MNSWTTCSINCPQKNVWQVLSILIDQSLITKALLSVFSLYKEFKARTSFCWTLLTWMISPKQLSKQLHTLPKKLATIQGILEVCGLEVHSLWWCVVQYLPPNPWATWCNHHCINLELCRFWYLKIHLSQDKLCLFGPKTEYSKDRLSLSLYYVLTVKYYIANSNK